MSAVLFLFVTVSMLWTYDVRMWFMRIFAPKRVVGYLNKSVPRWSRMVIRLMRMFLKFKAIDETSRALRARLPENFILIANHQSLIDIVMVFCFFPKHNMRFVAKKSLGKWFPGVSMVLRSQRHGLITRNANPKETVTVVTKLAKQAYREGQSPVIFPEGSRSRTGELGTFQAAGLRMINERAPLPLVIAALDGGYKIAAIRNLLAPIPKQMLIRILDILPAPKGKTETGNALDKAKSLIAAQLSSWRGTAVQT